MEISTPASSRLEMNDRRMSCGVKYATLRQHLAEGVAHVRQLLGIIPDDAEEPDR